MATLPVLNVQLNALDMLLATLGVRLNYLSKHSDDTKFTTLIAGKKLAIQFSSDDGVARYYRIENNRIDHAIGRIDDADLSVHFTDSSEGLKLLTQGDTSAFMQAISDGKLVIAGDYKLVLWLMSLMKHALKVPEAYQPYVDNAKPYLHKATPYLAQATPYLHKAKPYLAKVGYFTMKTLSRLMNKGAIKKGTIKKGTIKKGR